VKIAVVGLGYVGLSNAILLAQHNEVVAVDVLERKVDMVNSRASPVDDADAAQYLALTHKRGKKLDIDPALCYDKLKCYEQGR